MDNTKQTENQPTGTVNFLVISDSRSAKSVVYVKDLGLGPIRIKSGEVQTISLPVGAHMLSVSTYRDLNDKQYMKSLYINFPGEIISVEIRIGGFTNFININSNMANMMQNPYQQPVNNNIYTNSPQQQFINGNPYGQQPVMMQQNSTAPPVQMQPVYNPVQQPANNNSLLQTLAGRITAEGVLWIIVGSIQLLLSLIFYLSLLGGITYAPGLIFSYMFILAIGIVNLVVGIKHCNTAKRINTDCRGVTVKYAFKNAIGMYIWNTIVIISCIFSNSIIDYIFAGLIIAVIIVDIAGVRSFVSKNQQALFNLENNCFIRS